jgi:uncharacterized SAM-binding protein YcdF (DUF218 family)
MSPPARCASERSALVVHGHRDGNAPAGRPSISEECVARLRAAERAARRHKVADVLLCGAGAPGFPSEARQMAMRWRGPHATLWLDEDSTDTAENAMRALQWSATIGARHLLVVSSWWHVRLWIYYRPFRSLGLVVHQVRARRCDDVFGHLAHELRYLPEAIGKRRGLHGDLAGSGPIPYRP